MMNDKLGQVSDLNSQAGFSIREVENMGVPALVKGEIFWELKCGDEILNKGHVNNKVTLDASILMARFLKGVASPIAHESEPAFGVLALAVGTGYVGWDPQSPPAATNTQRSLWNEIGRKAVASTSYITPSGNISSTPTNVVDFSFVFGESEAVGPIVEMGLIGGDINPDMNISNPITPPNGTYDPTVNVVGKDILLNYAVFKVLNKPARSTLNWTWRLTL